jgi:hypothetical protein
LVSCSFNSGHAGDRLRHGFYGAEFVKGARKGPIDLFLTSEFPCSTWEGPFPRPDPHDRGAGARRSGQGWARVSAPAKGLALDGFEHAGTLGRVGMTRSRRSSRVVHVGIAPHPSIRWDPEDPDHDAVMRIGSEAPKRRAHSLGRHESHSHARDTATSNRHRRPVTSVCGREPKP